MGSQEREGVSGNAGCEGVCEEVGVGTDGVLAVVTLIYEEDVSTVKLQVPVRDNIAAV